MWSIQIPETHKEQCMTNVAPHFKSPFSQASAADAHLPLYLEDLHSRPYWSSRAATTIVTKGPSTPFFPKSFFAPIHTSQFPPPLPSFPLSPIYSRSLFRLPAAAPEAGGGGGGRPLRKKMAPSSLFPHTARSGPDLSDPLFGPDRSGLGAPDISGIYESRFHFGAAGGGRGRRENFFSSPSCFL